MVYRGWLIPEFLIFINHICLLKYARSHNTCPTQTKFANFIIYRPIWWCLSNNCPAPTVIAVTLHCRSRDRCFCWWWLGLDHNYWEITHPIPAFKFCFKWRRRKIGVKFWLHFCNFRGQGELSCCCWWLLFCCCGYFELCSSWILNTSSFQFLII